MPLGTVAVRLLAALCLVAATTFASPSLANADVNYPAGCVPVAQTTPGPEGWALNCWVGAAYERNGNFTVGVQRILQGFFHYGGAIDGLWGPATYSGVVGFQSQRWWLADDGVVGNATWAELQSTNHSYAYLGSGFGFRYWGAGFNSGYVAFNQCFCMEFGWDEPYRVLHWLGGSTYPYFWVLGPN